MNIYFVYQKYNKDFIAYAKSITGNENTALDIIQDAYVKALENEDIFSNMNEYQIKGWFFTVIKNKNIDRIRKEKKVVWVDEYFLGECTEIFEDKIIMKELLKVLPEKNRQILILKYCANLNSTEIGKILKISPSTVRSRLSASIKLLRDKLGRNKYVSN